MAWFLCVLRLAPRLREGGQWTSGDEDAVERHFRRLQRLAETGDVKLAGRTDEPDSATMGLVLYRAGSADEARRLVDEDPAVADGVMEAELRPFRLAVEGR